jgi:hypothetical protein
MFSLFKKENNNIPPDVKSVRDRLLRFIKDQLQQWEGGEGGNIRFLHLYINPAETDKELYEAAVYKGEDNRLKEEVQRIADDYAIDLPADWQFEVYFSENIPADAIAAKDLAAALLVRTGSRKPAQVQHARAFIKVLHGEAEQELYTFDSESGRVNIGRDKKVQAGDGFYRENTIAFPATSQHESNRFVSRQHAHVEWDKEGGVFMLYADEGGVPPRNKVKVRPQGGEAIKLQSTHIGYTLQHGDQIILGDSALLEFGIAP